MGTPRDTKYYCGNCNMFFFVKGFVARELEKFNKKAYCPRCNLNEQTSKYKPTGMNVAHRDTSNDPPSDAQIRYIKSLGGMPSKVSTKREAMEYITKLKKLKGDNKNDTKI